MLPLLILIVPPSLIGGSYLMWYSGQNAVLSQSKKLIEPPPQSTASYSAGISTLIGTYGLLSTMIVHAENKTTAVVAKEAKYVPPKNLADIFQRIGRPVLMRGGAGAAAFFCAGAAQTWVALWYNNKK